MFMLGSLQRWYLHWRGEGSHGKIFSKNQFQNEDWGRGSRKQKFLWTSLMEAPLCVSSPWWQIPCRGGCASSCGSAPASSPGCPRGSGAPWSRRRGPSRCPWAEGWRGCAWSRPARPLRQQRFCLKDLESRVIENISGDLYSKIWNWITAWNWASQHFCWIYTLWPRMIQQRKCKETKQYLRIPVA